MQLPASPPMCITLLLTYTALYITIISWYNLTGELQNIVGVRLQRRH